MRPPAASPPALLALVALSSPAAAQGDLTFVDVAASSGTLNPSFGRGAAMSDLDQDGLPDLVTGDAGMANSVYRQQPDHTFLDVTAAWGIAPLERETWCSITADLDNDGDDEIYFANGGFPGPETNRLLRNDLATSSTFTDVSDESGAGDHGGAAFGCTLLDYDLDGDLDIFLANHQEACALLENQGGLVFTDVSVAAGFTEEGSHLHCSSGDYDNDGWTDVGVGSRYEYSRLYRNEQDGTFAEVGEEAGVRLGPWAFGLVFEDFDNDGWQDIWVPIWDEDESEISGMYLNDGDGTFTDVSEELAVSGFLNMGHNVHDLNADGYAEIYSGTGKPASLNDDDLFAIEPDGLGGIVSLDVSVSSGIQDSGPSRAHGMAIGDYDQDGDVDVYVNNGGPSSLADTLQDSFFWQNQGNDNGWWALELEGVLSSRTPVGARVEVASSTGRTIYKTLDAGRGFGNTNLAELFFGLGSDPAIDRVEVRWPSGVVQLLFSPAADSRVTLLETGLRVVGDVTPGASVDFEACGPAGHVAEVMWAANTWEVPVPGFAGAFHLFPPIQFLASLPLDSSGIASVPLTVPTNPALIGAPSFFQAWIHAPGQPSGGTLSNAVDYTIQ